MGGRGGRGGGVFEKYLKKEVLGGFLKSPPYTYTPTPTPLFPTNYSSSSKNTFSFKKHHLTQSFPLLLIYPILIREFLND